METFSVLLTFMWSVRKKIVYFISFWHENLEHFFSSSFICTWLKTVWNSITKQLSRTFVPLNRWVCYNQISARVGRWSHAQTFSLKFTNHRNCALLSFSCLTYNCKESLQKSNFWTITSNFWTIESTVFKAYASSLEPVLLS